MKIHRFAAWCARIEPKWCVGWAIGTSVTAVTLGTTWVLPVAYLLMASLANQRNQVERSRDDWYRRTLEWENLSNTWMALYEHEKGKNRDLGQ